MKKHEVSDPKATYIWSVKIFSILSSVTVACSFLDCVPLFWISIKILRLFGLQPQVYLLNGTLVQKNWLCELYFNTMRKPFSQTNKICVSKLGVMNCNACYRSAFDLCKVNERTEEYCTKRWIVKGSSINHVDMKGEGETKSPHYYTHAWFSKIVHKGG